MGNNEFCTPSNADYPKWGLLDAFAWKATPDWKFLRSYGGSAQLIGYKQAWISYNKKGIIFSAQANQIPADLLACVIFNEVWRRSSMD